MKHRYALYAIFALLLAFAFGQRALAQDLPKNPDKDAECASPKNMTAWVNCRVDVIAAARINQRGTTKQVETPSIGTDTTSLVDRTEAPDLFGLALNFAGLGGKDNTNGSDTTVTTTAYALYAAAHHNDALDPAFYLKYAGLRRLSFTVGREAADKDTPDDKRGFIFGFKYLIVNKRDASSVTNREDLKKVSNRLSAATVDFANLEDEVETYIFDQLKSKGDDQNTFNRAHFDTPEKMQATLAALTIEQHDAIDKIIEKRIGTAVALRDESLRAFEKIRHRPQLSFSFQTNQRPEDGTDEYRTGLLFDYGLYQRLNIAANATFDYDDSKVVGGDKRGGRLAVESYFHLNRPNNIFSGKDPITLSFTGEGKWMSAAKPTYVGQVKLTLPLFDGVTLPFSFSVANRSDLIKESKVRGRFGFTFDMAKLLKGLQK